MDTYDRAGLPISTQEWGRLFNIIDYKRVATTDVGPYWVSTVWLGMDHSFTMEGPPIIFETMVFSKDERDDPDHRGLSDIDCRRYSTEQEALAGHEELVILIQATLQEELDGLSAGPEDGSAHEGTERRHRGSDREGPGGPERGGGAEVQRPRPGDGDRDLG